MNISPHATVPAASGGLVSYIYALSFFVPSVSVKKLRLIKVFLVLIGTGAVASYPTPDNTSQRVVCQDEG